MRAVKQQDPSLWEVPVLITYGLFPTHPGNLESPFHIDDSVVPQISKNIRPSIEGPKPILMTGISAIDKAAL